MDDGSLKLSGTAIPAELIHALTIIAVDHEALVQLMVEVRDVGGLIHEELVALNACLSAPPGTVQAANGRLLPEVRQEVRATVESIRARLEAIQCPTTAPTPLET